MYYRCEVLDHLHYDLCALEMEFEVLFCFDESTPPVLISTHHMEYIIPFTLLHLLIYFSHISFPASYYFLHILSGI